MKKYIEKLKSTTLNLDLWKMKTPASAKSPESVWSQKSKNEATFFKWLLISLPVVAFLILGLYFVIVDVKIFNSELNKKNAIIESNFSEKSLQSIELINQTRSNVSATGANGDKLTNPDEIALKTTSDVQEKVKEENAEVEEGEEEEEEEEDPSLIVRFDYVDIEDLPKEEQIIEDVVSPNGNKSKETLIILKNDDSGKKIFLKTSSIIEGPGGTVFEDERWESEAGVEEVAEKKQTTTPKAFIYSPTIPQATLKKVKTDETTIKYNTTEDSVCFSTKLGFCEGILPYDVVQLPNVLGVKRYSDLAAILPYFQMIIDSECSLRAREFICSILEPECRPEGQRQSPPCKLNCKVVSDDCKDFILQTLPLSKVFDCRQYPDWSENEECLNFSKGKCYEDEFQCSDGTCIPSKWVCDGVHDCPGSRPSFEETNCQGCTDKEFRCVLDGRCIPLHWKCDGQIDCVDHSDEMSC